MLHTQKSYNPQGMTILFVAAAALALAFSKNLSLCLVTRQP